MKMIAVLLALVAGPAVAQAQAQAQAAPPEGLVWMVLRDINEVYFDPDDPTNRPPLVTEVPEGVIRPVVVSDDGQSDWLVDYEAAGVNAFCGTGGCVRRLYVSTPDGLVRAFDAQALQFELVETGAQTQIRVAVHHVYCGIDQWDCHAAFRWDAAARKLVSTPLPKGEAAADGYQPLNPVE